MSDAPQGKILKKQRVRFTIDLDVEINDAPQAGLDSLTPTSGKKTKQAEQDQYFYQYNERLLQAILNHPDAANLMLINHAGYLAAERFSADFMSSSGQENELDQAIDTAAATLSDKDQRFLQKARKNGVFLENTTPALFDSISGEIVGYKVEILPAEE